MGGLDPAKILIILVLALVVLGPERLPQAARQIGAFWHDFQQWRQRLEEEVRSAVPDLELPPLPPVRRGGITSYLAGIMTEADRARASTPTAEGAATAANLAEDGMFAEPTGRDELVVPNGVPASWSSSGAELPGYAGGSVLAAMPVSAPEAALDAKIRLDLDDPSWN